MNQIKELKYPFVSAVNPKAAKMQLIVDSWLENNYAFLPKGAKEMYRKTQIGYCAGCIYPTATLSELTTVSRFFIWAFLIDDAFEFSNPEQVSEIRRKALFYLKGGMTEGKLNYLYRDLPVLHQELLALGSAEWLDRFCDTLEIYFEGLIQETQYRKLQLFPDLDTFIGIRIKAVNVYPMIALAEAISAKVLPLQVMLHPHMKAIAIDMCRVLSWANDFYSCAQEIGKGWFNLILVLENQYQCSLDQAYDKFHQINDTDLERLIYSMEHLPHFGICQGRVVEYVNGLKNMIAGYLTWTEEYTQRYTPDGHASDHLQGIKLAEI